MKQCAILLLAALPLAAANGAAGKWTIEGEVAGYPLNMTCSVQQDADAKLAGTCELKGNDGTENVKLAGLAKGEKIQFSFTTGSGYTLQFTGGVQSDTMKGDIEVSGASGNFTGKRVAE